MSKKAESDMRTVTIAIVVAVLVLALVLIFVFEKGNYLKSVIRILLPDFGIDNHKKGTPEIIGYNLNANTLEYFDGTTWHVIQDAEQKVGSKVIDKSTASSDFVNYYNRDDLRGARWIKIDDRIINNLYLPTIIIPVVDLFILDIAQGEVYGFLRNEVNSQDLKNYGEIRLSQADIMTLAKPTPDFSSLQEPETIPQNSELYIETAQKMAEWRDSILEHPILIHHDSTQAHFCPEKVPNGIRVDLSKPVPQTAQC